MSNIFRQLANDILRSGIREALDVVFDGGGGSGGGFWASLFSSLTGRATGGDVRAGQAYEVGEHGRELFVPGQSGTIINAAQTQRLTSAQPRGAAVTLNYSPVIDARGADQAAVARIEANQRAMAAQFDGQVQDALRKGRNYRRNQAWERRA